MHGLLDLGLTVLSDPGLNARVHDSLPFCRFLQKLSFHSVARQGKGVNEKQEGGFSFPAPHLNQSELIKSYSKSSPSSFSTLKPLYSGGSVYFSDDYTPVSGAELAAESSVENKNDHLHTSTEL